MMGGVNGTPQEGRHRALGAKPVTAAGSGGAASGGGCGSHALIPDPQSMSAADALVSSLVAAAVLGLTVWTVVALVAWRQRGER